MRIIESNPMPLARCFLFTFALSPLVFAGCSHNPPATNPNVEATPTGPCRDDERLENGRCVPRIPGDNLPASAR